MVAESIHRIMLSEHGQEKNQLCIDFTMYTNAS